VQIDGEEVETTDDDDYDYDYGNRGIGAGKVYVVECDCDEAIDMALTCGLGVGVERGVWERAQIAVCHGKRRRPRLKGECSYHGWHALFRKHG